MKRSEAPPFPEIQVIGHGAGIGDPTVSFLHPGKVFWVVSPDEETWVLYTKGPKVPIGYEDLRELATGRRVKPFDGEDGPPRH